MTPFTTESTLELKPTEEIAGLSKVFWSHKHDRILGKLLTTKRKPGRGRKFNE